MLPGITTQSHPIATTITDLEPEPVYHDRVVAVNITGVTPGPDMTFTTLAAPKIEGKIGPASDPDTAPPHRAGPRRRRARPPSTSSTGRRPSRASTTPRPDRTSSAREQPAADLTGLTPGTTYHYRVVATNPYGRTVGPDDTFTTLPAPRRRRRHDAAASAARRAR